MPLVPPLLKCHIKYCHFITNLVTVYHRPQNVANVLNGGRIAVNAPHGAPLGVVTPTNHLLLVSLPHTVAGVGGRVEEAFVANTGGVLERRCISNRHM